MRRAAFVLMSVCYSLLPTHAARAGAMAPPPPFPFQLAQAEAVLVGKVTAFEPHTVLAPRGTDATDRVEYRVAVVKVEDALVGGKGLTHVKVGVAPPQTFRGSGGVPRVIPAATLTVGQEVLLLLRRHPSEPFWVMASVQDAVDAKSAAYRTHRELARKAGRLLADPLSSLKAKDAGDRLLTATLLLVRHREPRPNHRLASIPADESRALLEALAAADLWEGARMGQVIGPLKLFYELGLTEKDGWRQPVSFLEVPAAAQAWLKKNAATYRIQGYVLAKSDK